MDELINYYENVIRGHIKKFTAGQRNSVTGIIQESAYCEESGMEAIWLAKSGPKGLLARTEGWENNPAGGAKYIHICQITILLTVQVHVHAQGAQLTGARTCTCTSSFLPNLLSSRNVISD